MDKINSALKKLGLNNKEVKIYLALLELGTGTIQQVAKKAEITRTNIYDHIGSMKNMGLVSEVKHDKKTLLIPENPQKLQNRAQESLNGINKMMPELLSIFNTPGTKPKVKFFEGKKGLLQAYNIILEDKPKKVFTIIDVENMMKVFPEKYMWQWADIRAKKEIFFYSIIKDDRLGRLAKKKDQQQLRETRLVKDVKFSTEIHIYDNKVIMISFNKPYGATIIEDIAIADTMKAMWQGWWNSLK